MSVQIVKHQIIVFRGKFIDELGDPLTVVETVIIEENYAADLQPWPNPVHDVLGRLVDVNIDMTEAERIAVDDISSIVMEYALKYLDVIKG